MLTIDPIELGNPKAHHYLLGAVGPRPICFASTIDSKGNRNLAPFSFFNVFSSNPPVAIFSPARSGRTGKQKDTYNNVKQVSEVVINLVNYNMVEQMSLSSSPYQPNVDEFIKSGFTPIASETIRPYRVKESPVQMECDVFNIMELGENGGAGNLIMCKIKKIHIQDDILDNNNMIDQHKIDLVSRMGGNWYCRSDKNSMFEITKPITTCGIGFDNIPNEILNSSILSGNDLGKLGGIEQLPNETEVNEYKLTDLSELFIEYEDNQKQLELVLHQKAKSMLNEDLLEEAWKTLLAFNN
ncbi:MAG: flavin reductase [Crocinitomicaceae bacterium]|nr:flavin reductase [Crocinitomicaceae bacterium]|tara:strand:+ start:1499 stop:2392 length:894 start_codon:yes stop_codon:yes gene_type:complete